MTSNEEWRDVVGFAGHYQISNLGNVRSVDRVVVDGRGRTRQLQGRPLRARVDHDGYLMVGLSVCGVRWTRTIHDLVAAAFHGERPDGHEIHHINRQRWDNRATNLRYKPEHLHITEHFTGEANPNSKLTAARIEEIRTLLANGYSQRRVARQMQVNQSTVSRVAAGRTWVHVAISWPDRAQLSFTDGLLDFSLDQVTELAF